jgi:hypothetical protein
MRESIYMKPISEYMYRKPNLPFPEITGVYNIKPEGLNPRPCYELTYEDGQIDFVPVSSVEAGHCQIVLHKKRDEQMQESLTVEQIDELDDHLWDTIHYIAGRIGIRGVTNDEFDNDMISEIRNKIVDHLQLIQRER